MGLREKVALLIILGVACTLCMPKTLNKSALKQYLKNFKKTKYNRGFSPLPKQVFKQKNYDFNINNNEHQNQQINKAFNFPEIEYPKTSNILRSYEPDVAPYESLQKNDLVDQTRKLNNLRKEAKLKYKIEKATQKNQSNSTRYGSKLTTDPDPFCFKNIGTYPEVQYPLSVTETSKPNFWNYLPFVDQSRLSDDFQDSKKCIKQENTTPSSNGNNNVVHTIMSKKNQYLGKMSPELQSQLREKVKTAVQKYILDNEQNISISTMSKYVDDTTSLPLLYQILQKNISEVNKPRTYRNSQPHAEETRLPITTASSSNPSENNKETNTVSLNLKKENTASKNPIEDINTFYLLEEANEPLSYVKSKSNTPLLSSPSLNQTPIDTTIDSINKVIHSVVVGTSPTYVPVDSAVDLIPTTISPIDITNNEAMAVTTPQPFSSTFQTTNQRTQTRTPSTSTLTIPNRAICTDSPHIVATSHSVDMLNTQDALCDIQPTIMLANTAHNTDPQTALSANITCLEPCVLTFSSEACKNIFKRILSTCSLASSTTTPSPKLLGDTQNCPVATTDNLVSNKYLNIDEDTNASMILISNTSSVITSVPRLQSSPLNSSTSTPDHLKSLDFPTCLDTTFKPQCSSDIFNRSTIPPKLLLPCDVTNTPSIFKTTFEPYLSTNTSTGYEIARGSTLLNNNTVSLSTPSLQDNVSINFTTVSEHLIPCEPTVTAETIFDSPVTRDSHNSVINPVISLSEYTHPNLVETFTPLLLNDKIDKLDTTPAPLLETDLITTLKSLGPKLPINSQTCLTNISIEHYSSANNPAHTSAPVPGDISVTESFTCKAPTYVTQDSSNFKNLLVESICPDNLISIRKPSLVTKLTNSSTELTNSTMISTPPVKSHVPITSKTADPIINHKEIVPKTIKPTTKLMDTFEFKATTPMPTLYDSGILITSLSTDESCFNPTTTTANPMTINSFTPHIGYTDHFTESHTIYDESKPLSDRKTDDMNSKTTFGPKSSTDFQTDIFERSPNSNDPLLLTKITSSSTKTYEPPISVNPPSSLTTYPGLTSNNLLSSHSPNILASEFKPSLSHVPQTKIATTFELPLATASNANLKSQFVTDPPLTCLVLNVSLPLSNGSPSSSKTNPSLVATESQITSTTTSKPYLVTEPLTKSILSSDEFLILKNAQKNISIKPRPLKFGDSPKCLTTTMESLLSTPSSNNSLTTPKPMLLNNQPNFETTLEITKSTTAAETSDDDIFLTYSSETASPISLSTSTPHFEDTVHIRRNLNINYGNSKSYNDRLTSDMIPTITSTPAKENFDHTTKIISSNLVLDPDIVTATPIPLFITSSIPLDNTVSVDSLILANPVMEDVITTKSSIKEDNFSVTTPTPVAERNTDSANSVDSSNINSPELTRYRKNVEDDYALMLADIIESTIEQCLSDILYDEIDYENGDYANSSVDNYNDTNEVSATITSTKNKPSLTFNSSESLTNSCEWESDTNSTSHIDKARNTSIRAVESIVPYITTVDNYILTHPSMIAIESPTADPDVPFFPATGSILESTTISVLPIASSLPSSGPSAITKSSEDTLDKTPSPTSLNELKNDEISMGLFKKSLLKALDLVIMKLKF